MIIRVFGYVDPLPVLLTAYEQESYGVSAVTMVKEELAWLEEVKVPSSPCFGFQTLLSGHLQFCRTLFTCEGIDKLELGKRWIGEAVKVIFKSLPCPSPLRSWSRVTLGVTLFVPCL